MSRPFCAYPPFGAPVVSTHAHGMPETDCIAFSDAWPQSTPTHLSGPRGDGRGEWECNRSLRRLNSGTQPP
uniref:Uncharacterized protein n=1 Tax=Mesocestoides corti TaxID=53468 RepID=A0A5K3EQC0_MESCO